MPPYYVVFDGKKPGIYFTWYECAKQVLREERAIYQKYNNYDYALRDFNARVLKKNTCCYQLMLLMGMHQHPMNW
jgi:viroplasmin and RNaseH domain-containing protein